MLHFTCPQKTLKTALNTVKQAVRKDTPMAILQFLKIQSFGAHHLVLFATSLDLCIQCKIEATVLKQGEVLLPATRLAELVDKVSDEAELDIKELESSVTVKSHRGKATFVKHPELDQFPHMPDLTGTRLLEHFETDQLIDSISHVSFAALKEVSRPILCNLSLQFDTDALRIAASDSNRLAMVTHKLEHKERSELLIRAENMSTLSRVLPKGDIVDILSLSTTQHESPNMAMFRTQSTGLCVGIQLDNGKYPNILQAIPIEDKSSLIVNMEDMRKAVKQMSPFARSVEDTITLHFKDEECALEAYSDGVGSNQVSIEATKTGENVELHLRDRQLLECLEAMKQAERVSLHIGTKQNTLAIRPYPPAEYPFGYHYVVVPMVKVTR
jgi:DNA polymerase-3 subunit beta